MLQSISESNYPHQPLSEADLNWFLDVPLNSFLRNLPKLWNRYGGPGPVIVDENQEYSGDDLIPGNTLQQGRAPDTLLYYVISNAIYYRR